MAAAAVSIDALTSADRDHVRRIYREGVTTGNATFETAASPWEDWDAAQRPDSRFVARQGGRVVGWAALSRVSERCVYGGVAEGSVDVAADARGGGVGRRLLEALVAAPEEAGVWTLQAGIFPENAAAIALHERCGFRRVGVRGKLGRLGGTWRDVAPLERRRRRAGIA